MYFGVSVIMTICLVVEHIDGSLLQDACISENAEGYPTYYLNGLCYVARSYSDNWDVQSCKCMSGIGAFFGGELFRDHNLNILLNLRTWMGIDNGACYLIGLRQRYGYYGYTNSYYYWEDRDSGCQSGRQSYSFSHSTWDNGLTATNQPCVCHCGSRNYFDDTTCTTNVYALCQFDLTPCEPLEHYPAGRRNTWVDSNNTEECLIGRVKRFCENNGQWGSFDYSPCKRSLTSDCSGKPYTACMDGSYCGSGYKCTCNPHKYPLYSTTLGRDDCVDCNRTLPVRPAGWMNVEPIVFDSKLNTAGTNATLVADMSVPDRFECNRRCYRTFGCIAYTVFKSTSLCRLHYGYLPCIEPIKDTDAQFYYAIHKTYEY